MQKYVVICEIVCYNIAERKYYGIGDEMLKAILSRKDLTQEQEFFGCVEDLLNDENVLRLKNFKHHYGATRFQHCLNVSYYNFLLCRFFGLDARAAARGGMLHDLFFYNRKEHV